MYKQLLRKKLIRTSLFTALLLSGSQVQAQQNALLFDGTNDYIQTNYPGVLGNAPRTVEAWVKTTATTGENLVVDWGSDSVNGGRFTIRLNALAGVLVLRVENKGGGVNGTVPLNNGNWHHIAVTYDNSLSTNKYKLYVDGVLDVQGDISQATNTQALTNMIISRRLVSSLGGYFNGSIDDVRVWTVARTQAEIQVNKNLEFCTPPANLAAYFKMNEGTAGANNTAVTSILSSAGSYTGAFNNFALNGSTSNFAVGAIALAPIDIDNTISLSGGTLTAAQAGATYQWIDCGNGNTPVGVTSQSYTPTASGNYAVIVTLGGCSETSNCQNVVTLGVNDSHNTGDFTLYPNPTEGRIILRGENSIDQVEIYNLAGQKVMEFKPNTTSSELNISQLNSGVYLVKIMSDNRTRICKIIKE